jgi:hypothetical protein
VKRKADNDLGTGGPGLPPALILRRVDAPTRAKLEQWVEQNLHPGPQAQRDEILDVLFGVLEDYGAVRISTEPQFAEQCDLSARPPVTFHLGQYAIWGSGSK